MKYFLISYRLEQGMEERRREEIATFIAAIDGDPELRGRVSYACLKVRDGDQYFHLATVADAAAQQTLQSRAFFQRYTAATEAVAVGEVDVTPLDFIAQTAAEVREPASF